MTGVSKHEGYYLFHLCPTNSFKQLSGYTIKEVTWLTWSPISSGQTSMRKTSCTIAQQPGRLSSTTIIPVETWTFLLITVGILWLKHVHNKGKAWVWNRTGGETLKPFEGPIGRTIMAIGQGVARRKPSYWYDLTPIVPPQKASFTVVLGTWQAKNASTFLGKENPGCAKCRPNAFQWHLRNADSRLTSTRVLTLSTRTRSATSDGRTDLKRS